MDITCGCGDPRVIPLLLGGKLVNAAPVIIAVGLLLIAVGVLGLWVGMPISDRIADWWYNDEPDSDPDTDFDADPDWMSKFHPGDSGAASVYPSPDPVQYHPEDGGQSSAASH